MIHNVLFRDLLLNLYNQGHRKEGKWKNIIYENSSNECKCGSLFSLGYKMHLHTDLCCSKSGEETVDVFLSFLLAEDDDFGLDLRFGDLLDFRGDGDGDNLDLTTSGEILRERI